MADNINYLDRFNNRVPVGEATPLKVNEVDTVVIEKINSKTINRTFGRSDDYVELAIYNINNELIGFESLLQNLKIKLYF